MATFIQQQNMVVSPVFESLKRLCSHTVQLFTGVTTSFCNRSQTYTFSGLTTCILETHVLCERNRTGQLFVCHDIQREREPPCRTNVRLPHVSCFHVFSVTYSDGEISCVSSDIFRSSQFSTGAAPGQFCVLHASTQCKCSALHPIIKAAVG